MESSIMKKSFAASFVTYLWSIFNLAASATRFSGGAPVEPFCQEMRGRGESSRGGEVFFLKRHAEEKSPYGAYREERAEGRGYRIEKTCFRRDVEAFGKYVIKG